MTSRNDQLARVHAFLLAKRCMNRLLAQAIDDAHKLGLSDRAIARVVGVSHETIRNWRKRDTFPDLERTPECR